MRGSPTTGPRRYWTDAEEQLLRELYPDHPTRDVAARLDRGERAVYARAKALGLRKSAEYLASPAAQRIQPGQGKGSATRFKKGHQPWNKGTEYRPTGRAIETQFKPGHMPHTHKPIGSEAIRDGYLWRKIRDDSAVARFNWVEVHRIVWEEAHGPIPDGHVVVFRNGNRLDIRLENLELITRAELARRNGPSGLPPKLREANARRAHITRQLNKMRQQQ